MASRPTQPPIGAAAPAVVTVLADGIERPLVVPLGSGGDPSTVVAALSAELGTTDLVVDRSGVALRGAIAGRDLLSGDRLVGAGHRSLPALAGLVGPLQGASVTVDRELFLGRGGRFGTVTIDDPEVSRDHLHIWPTPGALLAVDVGSTNGTSRNDEPLVGTVALRSGDRLELGASVLVVIGDPPRADHLRPAGAQVQLRPAGPVAPVEKERGDQEREDGPDLALIASAIAGWSALLWSRPWPAGTGPRIRLGSAAAPGSASDPWASAGSLDLGRHRSVAVVGPPRMAAGHVAAWVLQLAALHPPEDLAIEVRGDPDRPSSARWLEEGSRWLPHHPGPGEDRAGTWALTILGDPQVPEPVGADGTTVWLLEPDDPVPGGCSAVVGLDDTGRATLRTSGPSRPARDDRRDLAFVADRVEPATFSALARLLAPLCTQPAPAPS